MRLHGFRRSGKLSYSERMRLPERDFVFPKSRRYPIPDESHARNALARVSQHGSEEDKRKVCEAVHKRFPEIHEKSCPMHRSEGVKEVHVSAHFVPAHESHSKTGEVEHVQGHEVKGYEESFNR